ncbi:MAG: MAPEG family protein [Agitococcus sp.]|jgi:hypothetical protein|nr:MAPEG family protein [Agitococcus sp.]MDO9178228.1 MAPEG family protein [Agitococcus sp.]
MHSLVMPMLSLMSLTAFVWVWMYITRIGYMQKNHIDPQAVFSRVRLLQVLPDEIQAPANNLNNLLELPVIFYGLCLLNLIQQTTSDSLLNLAWLYVVLRVIHSLIQCSYNKVIHRFTVYFLSSIVLWLMLAISIQQALSSSS